MVFGDKCRGTVGPFVKADTTFNASMRDQRIIGPQTSSANLCKQKKLLLWNVNDASLCSVASAPVFVVLNSRVCVCVFV